MREPFKIKIDETDSGWYELDAPTKNSSCKTHYGIAKFVRKMEDDDKPTDDLLRFKHTITHAPIFEEFFLKL